MSVFHYVCHTASPPVGVLLFICYIVKKGKTIVNQEEEARTYGGGEKLCRMSLFAYFIHFLEKIMVDTRENIVYICFCK